MNNPLHISLLVSFINQSVINELGILSLSLFCIWGPLLYAYSTDSGAWSPRRKMDFQLGRYKETFFVVAPLDIPSPFPPVNSSYRKLFFNSLVFSIYISISKEDI